MATSERLTIREAQQRLASREISSVELTRSCLDRIHQVEDRVKAFVTVTRDLALQQAQEADRRIKAGQGGPLTGIPMHSLFVLARFQQARRKAPRFRKARLSA